MKSKSFIDKQSILEHADLLQLAERETNLRRVATTGGGEHAGPCPFCGGDDRFRVQPNRQPWGLWMCRHCTGGKWQNAIDFIIRRDSCDFRAACETLTGGELPTTREKRKPAPVPAYAAPADDWQEQAYNVIEICRRNLWDEKIPEALDFLFDRAIWESTARYFHLGVSPGAKFGDLWVPRGIVIPCMTIREVWYLKICLLPGDPVTCTKCKNPAKARQACPTCGEVNKYRGVKGNRTAAIYNADDLLGADLALFCEGEFDSMIAWQDLQGRGLAVCTMGAADNMPDLATWGAYLVNLRAILTAYDNDQAGKKGAARLAELSTRVKPCPLPDRAHDINDYYLRPGVNLWDWIEPELDRLGLLVGNYDGL